MYADYQLLGVDELVIKKGSEDGGAKFASSKQASSCHVSTDSAVRRSLKAWQGVVVKLRCADSLACTGRASGTRGRNDPSAPVSFTRAIVDSSTCCISSSNSNTLLLLPKS